ncbi:MAG: EAL domain-containing protein, partial [Lachnospiraceae bacterium]|nr:EAL domain-containing protein [Lachnospiraceae bacterium]
DFKLINDSLGSQTGDAVLIKFANILKEKLPRAIAIGRLGNDVFAVLIAKADFERSILSKNEQQEFYFGTDMNESFPIRSYIGVYNIQDRDLPVSVMCDRARMAIATIKGDYHKRIAYYDDALRKNILREQEFVADLPDAIANDQLTMFLQPQMSAKGELLGAEALIRWIHPQKGSILPSDFIPVFEKNGLITDVDQYIWEAACKQLRKWKDAGREDLYISVNISPRDFYFLNIYKIFTKLIEKYDINPANLKLEITETAIVMDFNRQMKLINKLRQDGFVVEMDDFGSGYSSLNLLKDLHVDILKIDMAFLKKANDEERSKKILQMIIGLSCRLDMPVITEGVETAEQVEFLSKMGCDMFQGYYFGRPMSVEEFESTYLQH